MKHWFFAILVLCVHLAGSKPSSAQAPQTPKQISAWILDGELVDDENIVRGFLTPLIDRSENWSKEDQRSVIEFLETIGYHSTIVNKEIADGTIVATIKLHPATLVRHIEVTMKTGLVERFRQPVFADDLAKKMTLRPGTVLAEDPGTRKLQLDAEGDRIRLYLINDGFFEAKVTVTERPDGPFEAHVVVEVIPGPPYMLDTIDIIGNEAVRKDEITPYFRHERLCLIPQLCFGQRRFSRRILLDDIQKLVRHYQHKEGFPGVRIRSDFDPRYSFNRADRTVNIRLDIRERRRIDVDIAGNTSYPDIELEKKLTLYEQASYDDVEVQSSADAIRNFYQGKGFFEAQVNWERERFTDLNFERILFFIDEGPKLRVRSVRFTGNTSLTSASIRRELGTQVFKRSLLLGGASGFTTSGLLEQDVNTIIQFYRSEGFRNARVRLEVRRAKDRSSSGPALAAAVAGQHSTKGLYVLFHIEEGPRTTVASTTFVFEGPHTASAIELQKQLTLLKSMDFQEGALQDDSEKLRRFYFARGYPRAVITAAIANNNDKVRIVYTVEENSQARIGKIALRGNFKTRDWVILQELGLREGRLLTLEVAERAQANLRRSGLFSSVSVKYIGRENPHQKIVNVLVRVEEHHDYSLTGESGGGYSTESELFVKLGGGVHNLGGIGANLDLNLIYGEKQRFGELKLGLPRWVMKRYVGTELNLESSITGRQDETERFGELTTVGGTIALSRQGRYGFFEGWQLSMRYDYRRRNRDVVLIRPAGNNDDIQKANTTTIGSSIGPRLVIDKRRDREGNRNPLNPGRGFYFEGRVLFAEDFLLGSDRFLKFGLSAKHHWSLNDRLMLSTGLRYDHGVPLGGVSLLPEVERFFAGGDTTVRGYEENHLAVELIDTPLAGVGSVTQFRVIPAGGNIRIIQNIDLQIEVWKLASFPVTSALFVDAGVITNSLDTIALNDIGLGVGMALARWVTPFGSFSLEYAIPMKLKLGDNPRGRFHVNFGVLFN